MSKQPKGCFFFTVRQKYAILAQQSRTFPRHPMLQPAVLRLIAAAVIAALSLFIAIIERTNTNTALGRICAVPPSATSTTFEEQIEIDPVGAAPPMRKLGVEVIRVPLMLEVSGYTSTEAQTDGDPCIASDMSNICTRKAHGELLCAASRNFPLGTRVHVEGLGTCTVVDYMNERYVMHVDWYFGQDAEGENVRYRRAMKIGRQHRRVRILSIP